MHERTLDWRRTDPPQLDTRPDRRERSPRSCSCYRCQGLLGGSSHGTVRPRIHARGGGGDHRWRGGDSGFFAPEVNNAERAGGVETRAGVLNRTRFRVDPAVLSRSGDAASGQANRLSAARFRTGQPVPLNLLQTTEQSPESSESCTGLRSRMELSHAAWL